MKFLVEINTEHPAFKDRGHTTSADALRDYLVGTGRRYDGAVTVTEVQESTFVCHLCEQVGNKAICDPCWNGLCDTYKSKRELATQPDPEAVPSS